MKSQYFHKILIMREIIISVQFDMAIKKFNQTPGIGKKSNSLSISQFFFSFSMSLRPEKGL